MKPYGLLVLYLLTAGLVCSCVSTDILNCTCTTPNYTISSSQLEGIREVTSALISNSSSSLFHNTSSSSSSTAAAAIYGMYQCRADISLQDCFYCVNKSLIMATQRVCPNSSIGAHIQMETCHVRYGSQPGLFDRTWPDLSPWFRVFNQEHNPTPLYQSYVLAVLGNVTTSAPSQKDLYNYSVQGIVYAQAQCDSYLSQNQCSACFGDPSAFNFSQSIGAQVYFGSCFYRFVPYLFFAAPLVVSYPYFPLSNHSSATSSSLPPSPSSYIPPHVVALVPSPLSAVSQKASSVSVGTIVGGVIGGILFVGLNACLLLFYYRNKKKSQALGLFQDLNPFHPLATIYSYNELRVATRDFHPHNKLGQGGFGPVYKGTLANGQEVAIKKLSIGSHQGNQEFMNEVTIITSVQHRNLIKLFGCCKEGPERLLVYEYLPNKSLDALLFDSGDGNHTNILLDWKTWVEIIQGIARGLAYLHEYSQVHIIHRDIKPGNILLDNDLTPKIADFGLARLFNNDTNHITMMVAGTIGYLSPEYAMRGELTEKADVFSFGVVTLEIVSGRKNTDYTQPEEKQWLLEWAWKCYREGDMLQLLDPRLVNLTNPFSEEEEEELARVIHVAILCTQSTAIDRPSMSKVGQLLAGKNENLDAPINYPFSTSTTLDTSTSFSLTHHSSHNSSLVSKLFSNVTGR